MTEKKKYKLIGLQIEGIRLIKACYLQFKPSGLTEIIGKNNQGKSSVIDAIEILFEGFKQKVDDIISHGSDKAVIIGELEEFTIKRVMTEKTDRLEVITKQGFKPQKPQDFLNSLINKLTFRPQVFLDKKPEDKLKSVMEILKIDFSQENKDIATKTTERLLTGRELANLGEKTEPEKVDPVDTADLLKQKQDIHAFNETEKEKQFDATFFTTILNDFEYKIKNNTSPARKDGLTKIKKTVQEVIKALPQPEYKTTEDIDSRIATASQTNQKAQAYKDYFTWKSNKDKKQADYNKITKEINDLKDKKVKKLAETEMPVEGLTIKEVTEGNYGLFYENIYCENWSTSLGWKIALGICSAMQPDLRACFLDNGEAMDSDTRKSLDLWAIKNNIQVILTVVDKIPEQLSEGTLYIEQGRIFSTEGDCVPEEKTPEPEPEQTKSESKERPKMDTTTLF